MGDQPTPVGNKSTWSTSCGFWGPSDCQHLPCCSRHWTCVQPAPKYCRTGKDNQWAEAPVTAAPQAIKPKPLAQKQLFHQPPAFGPVCLFPKASTVCPQAPAAFTFVAVPTSTRVLDTSIAPLAPCKRGNSESQSVDNSGSQRLGTAIIRAVCTALFQSIPKELWFKQTQNSTM